MLVGRWSHEGKREGRKRKGREEEATSFLPSLPYIVVVLVCLLACFICYIVCFAEQVSIVIEQLQKLKRKYNGI